MIVQQISLNNTNNRIKNKFNFCSNTQLSINKIVKAFESQGAYMVDKQTADILRDLYYNGVSLLNFKEVSKQLCLSSYFSQHKIQQWSNLTQSIYFSPDRISRLKEFKLSPKTILTTLDEMIKNPQKYSLEEANLKLREKQQKDSEVERITIVIERWNRKIGRLWL